MASIAADPILVEKVRLVYARAVDEAVSALEAGYEPVECSFGAQSVVGSLMMDHHGEYAHLPGVTLRAHGEDFGARAADPRFVVTGNPDADAVGAIVGLAGVHRLSPDEARLINANDLDPVAVGDLRAHGDAGMRLLAFQVACRQACISLYSEEGFRLALEHFLRSYTRDLAPEFVARISKHEDNRVQQGRKGFRFVGRVGFARSPEWAFDVWYRDCPVVVAWVRKTGRVTIGARNEATAIELCGSGRGLLDLVQDPDFVSRFGTGWGGRPSIVGNPRGETVTPTRAEKVWLWMHSRIDAARDTSRPPCPPCVAGPLPAQPGINPGEAAAGPPP